MTGSALVDRNESVPCSSVVKIMRHAVADAQGQIAGSTREIIAYRSASARTSLARSHVRYQHGAPVARPYVAIVAARAGEWYWLMVYACMRKFGHDVTFNSEGADLRLRVIERAARAEVPRSSSA